MDKTTLETLEAFAVRVERAADLQHRLRATKPHHYRHP